MLSVTSRNIISTATEESKGPCLLTDAIVQRDFDKLKELIQTDKNIIIGTTWDPIHIAVSLGCHKTVEFLIQNGASVDSTLELKYPESGFTPLHFAAQENHLESARILLKYGASVSSKIEGVCDPIHLAVFYGHVEMAALLLDHGANINARFNNNFFETTGDHLLEVEVLGEKMHKILWQDHNLPLFHCSILRRFDQMTKLLLDRGADVDLKTSLGKTTLMQAVEVNDSSLVEYLIEERNADVKDRDIFGKPAIHFTMLNANRIISKYSREEYAWRFEKEKIVTFLMTSGAGINSRFPEDSNYSSIVHYMIRFGYHEGLDTLLYYSNFDIETLDVNAVKLGKINYEDFTPDIVNDLDYIQELRRSFEKITYSLVTYTISRHFFGFPVDRKIITQPPIHEWLTRGEYITEVKRYKNKLIDELDTLKQVKIGDSDITLYHLCLLEKHQLITLMSNKRLNIFELVNRELLDKHNVVYFYWMIRCRVEFAHFDNLYSKQCTELIFNWFVNQVPYDCCEIIVSYLDDLTLRELSSLTDDDKSNM